MPTTYECLPFGLLATNNDGDPRTKCIIVSKSTSDSVTKPATDISIDLCNSLCGDCGCDTYEYVSTGDYTPIYVDQKSPLDTFQFEVRKKDGTGTIITDSSFGEYVANESWIADWELIKNIYGKGIYNIIITSNVLGVDKTETSHDIYLVDFDVCKSKGFVKFQWWIAGSIEDGREFGETERYYEARIKGFMFMETPETETETYLTGERELKTIQTTQKRVYKFQSKLLPYKQAIMILDNLAFGDRFTVTDYQDNTKDYSNLELKLEKIDNLEDKVGSNEYSIVIAFTDLKQNKIKRPC